MIPCTQITGRAISRIHDVLEECNPGRFDNGRYDILRTHNGSNWIEEIPGSKRYWSLKDDLETQALVEINESLSPKTNHFPDSIVKLLPNTFVDSRQSTPIRHAILPINE